MLPGYVFVEFDKLWMAEKPNIMQFNEMRDKYEKALERTLASPSVLLGIDAVASELIALECWYNHDFYLRLFDRSILVMN